MVPDALEDWRIDVGISEHYGSTLEALEIVGDTVTVLTAVH